MSASAIARLLACVAALALGCEAKLLVGRNDAAAACGTELVMPPAMAVANEELYRCRLFTLDALRDAAGSEHVYITKAAATMMPYGHEIDVRIAPEIAGVADGPIDCSFLVDQPVPWVPLITSLGESEEWDFESAPLATTRSQRLLIGERFANPSPQPIMVGVMLRLECASTPPPRPSQTFEFVDAAAHVVGPADQLTVSASCNIDSDGDVSIWRLFRPPQRISTFAVFRDHQAQPFWTGDTEWSTDLAPPLQLSKRHSFEWRCGYQNLGDTSFEIGGDSGYPCALMGIYQPVSDGEDAEPLRCTH